LNLNIPCHKKKKLCRRERTKRKPRSESRRRRKKIASETRRDVNNQINQDLSDKM
jgi:hypothetical protein